MNYNTDRIESCNTIEELFSIWKSKPIVNTTYKEDNTKIPLVIDHSGVFISDGYVDKDTWESKKDGKRILFVLKEAYGEDDDWSLTEWLRRTGPSSNIWYRVVEWTYGIINTTATKVARYSPDNISLEHSEDVPNEWLRQIAVVNLKKSGGRSSSNYSEISAYADADREELKREIEILDPDIVVCGATFSDINHIGGGIIKPNPCDNWYYYSDSFGGRERLFIDYYHPANRYPSLLNYYGLINIYQQALIEKETKK